MSETDLTPKTGNPSASARRWAVELEAAEKASKQWRDRGVAIVKRYLDERDSRLADDTRWNLFSANVDTLKALLYGQVPKVSCSRRYADSTDDVARVGGVILERILNTAIETDSEGFALSLQNALEDRLLPGLGVMRVRYEADTEEVAAVEAQMGKCPVCLGSKTTAAVSCHRCGGSGSVVVAPPVEAYERTTRQEVRTEYVHWQDFLFSPARTWGDVRWVAFRTWLTRDAAAQRFGDNIAAALPYESPKAEDTKDEAKDARDRVAVWEIWEKATRTVHWYAKGFATTLDEKSDPLRLRGFFPCPRPMVARATTLGFAPRADFLLAEDLYNEIDAVSTRITTLERAIAVRGVYDKANHAIRELLDPAGRAGNNQLIPVDGWGGLAEKGGLRGAIDWLPLEMVMNALTALRDYRVELIDALHQVTGMSDIMRGQAAQAGVTATEQGIKARFGSVRVQALQDEFARFASDIQCLKAEIMARLFMPETYLQQSNAMATADAAVAQAAVELLKSDASQWRVEVKPEAVALTDFAANKSEALEVVQSLSGYVTAMAPLASQMPQALPFLLEILQWAMARLRGSSTIEGVLDRAIQAAKQMPPPGQQQPQQDNSKLLAQQMKGQQDLAKVKAELQADLIREAAQVQADGQREATQRVENVREAAQKHILTGGMSNGRLP